MKYFIHTMGCKLNQFDSAQVAGRLKAGHLETASADDADLIVLNTCTVTHKADREARRLIRSFRRSNPHALVAVMGCSARLAGDVYAAMPEVDEVLPDAEAVRRFARRLSGGAGEQDHACVPYFGDRTRAFLKIQEGCNFPCSYCIIPTVRGRSRSLPVDRVARDFTDLVAAGFREVVLTGINTGEYGKDLGFARGLERLLERLLKVPGRFRIRLNSVEPRAVTPGLVALLRTEPALAKHLQIPLQSGSDRVLKAMRRNYTAGFYEDLVSGLAEDVPGIGIGADVLVGFPTETEEDFEQTHTLVERNPVSFIHAFTYSPRPGTPAADLPPVPPDRAAARTRSLRRLGDRKKRAFAAGFLGRTLQAVTLAPQKDAGRALTENFLDVSLPAAEPPNRLITVQIESASGATVTASPVQ